MKIGIDASRALRSERTGTENYAHELIEELARQAEPGDQFFLYVRKGARADFPLPDNFHLRGLGGRFLWTQLSLSRELLLRPVDALFVPAHTVPLIHPERTVVTVHGLEFEAAPDCYPRHERWLLRLHTQLSIRLARRVIVPSENTKKDLIRFYGTDPRKITVIPHGTRPSEPQARSAHAGFRLLFVGRLEKRKNLVRLIRAFELFLDASCTPDAQLVLAGKRGYGGAEIDRAIARSRYQEHISAPGYVTEAEKERLYAAADAFLFPSRYEGFGLPVLEAMERGVPVISSNIASLPEVAGNAALLADPLDPQQWRDALLSLHRDERLRAELSRRGRENCRRFTWGECAAKTLEAIKSLE